MGHAPALSCSNNVLLSVPSSYWSENTLGAPRNMGIDWFLGCLWHQTAKKLASPTGLNIQMHVFYSFKSSCSQVTSATDLILCLLFLVVVVSLFRLVHLLF